MAGAAGAESDRLRRAGTRRQVGSGKLWEHREPEGRSTKLHLQLGTRGRRLCWPARFRHRMALLPTRTLFVAHVFSSAAGPWSASGASRRPSPRTRPGPGTRRPPSPGTARRSSSRAGRRPPPPRGPGFCVGCCFELVCNEVSSRIRLRFRILWERPTGGLGVRFGPRALQEELVHAIALPRR